MTEGAFRIVHAQCYADAIRYCGILDFPTDISPEAVAALRLALGELVEVVVFGEGAAPMSYECLSSPAYVTCEVVEYRLKDIYVGPQSEDQKVDHSAIDAMHTRVLQTVANVLGAYVGPVIFVAADWPDGQEAA